MKKISALLISLAVALGASGCSTSAPISELYKQRVNWTLCETKTFQCGTVEVPLNWDEPAGPTIQISLVRKFTNKAIGSLVVNPGGPGGSGVDFLENNYDGIGTQTLRDKYTLVSFDPRGVARSAKVTCYDAAGTDHLLYDSNGAEPGSAADIASVRAELKKFDAACKQNTGPVLAHVDTVSAAKDMDVIRAALGSEKLDYLGFSYGTFLGTTYATLFPANVGHFVLDGAIDPRVSDAQQNLNQLQGFNLALNNYLKDCLANDASCPFKGSLADAQLKVSNFLRGMETKNLKTKDGRKLTITSASTGLIMALYSDTYWPYLTQAFTSAFKSGDGTTFILLADFYNDRDEAGKYSSNTLEANIAINCLDSRSSSAPEAMAKQNAKLLQVSPILGRYWQNGALSCEQWPYPVAKRPASYSAKGAPTIMVVGTTGDPATPYKQAVALAHKVLAKGFLVTFKGQGHTAYGRSNICVSNAVDNFLIEGTLPAKEPVC
jgi:pimeloyl-ACP methyl ester carboxylesterase